MRIKKYEMFHFLILHVEMFPKFQVFIISKFQNIQTNMQPHSCIPPYQGPWLVRILVFLFQPYLLLTMQLMYKSGVNSVGKSFLPPTKLGWPKNSIYSFFLSMTVFVCLHYQRTELQKVESTG